MATLIVFLPTNLPQASSQLEYLLTPDGRNVSAHASAGLSVLPAAGAAEVVAVVPVQALSWHWVQLPRGVVGRAMGADRAMPRLRAVLDGLLEEHLLDEPAQLHFALAPNARDSRDGTTVCVAACDRAWLRAWMQALEQHQRPAARIVPEFAPLTPAGAIHVIGTPTSPLVVFSPNVSELNANAQDARAGLAVLPLTPEAAALADATPGKTVFAEPALAELAERHFKRAATLTSRSERGLSANASPWDLAQFDLASSSGLRRWRRLAGFFSEGLHAPQWRAARWVAAALVLANLVGLNAWAWAQRTSLEAKRRATQEVLTSTFPAVKVVLDAPVQMTREVQRLRLAAGTASESDFEVLLAAFGELSSASPALAAQKPTAMAFDNGELRIQGLSLANVSLTDLGARARARSIQLRAQGDALVLSAIGSP
jgi:general secretion pathway protein L